MARKKDSSRSDQAPQAQPIEETSAGDTPQGPDDQPSPQRRVQIRIDESEAASAYVNAFRSNPSSEELMLDFGINRASATGGGNQITFHVTDRLYMNYFTAKRLAMALGQIVQRHEQRFGEVQLNAADRAKEPNKS